MSSDTVVTEVSDPREMTIDAPPQTSEPVFKVLKGQPSDEELAALVTVLAASGGSSGSAGPQELNLWGHPVDKLRYSKFSWQYVTLVGRTHMRR